MWVGWLRVTHPCATMVLLPPFDLHVLGLPLAFILSQDQTLHCKIFLHPCEHGLMSSANPTRVNEFNLQCYVWLSTCRSKSYHLSFPSIQRTCVTPCWANLVAFRPTLFSFSFPLLFDWECKGKKNF